MRKAWGILISATFWGGLYFLLAFLFKRLPGGSDATPFLFGFSATGWILGLIYPNTRFRALARQGSGRLLIGFGFLIVFGTTAYLFHLVSRSMRLYEVLTEEQPLFKGDRLRRSDTAFGYRHLPNVHAIDLKMPGDTIHVYTDRDGFRVRAQDTARVNLPGQVDILFIGCSFTYGEMCEADSIFADRTASSANLRSINAGVSGWGLSQMWLAAQQLIPFYKPKHVVFQYSYWLPQRGMSRYKASMGFPLPNPHFVVREDRRFALNLPGYASVLFDGDRNITRAQYAGSPIPFMLEKGMGIFLREDLNRLRDSYAFWRKEGKEISQKEEEVEALCQQIYQEMITLARQNGSVPHILYLTEWSRKPMSMDSLFLSRQEKGLVIDAFRYHEQYLREHPGLSRKWAFVHSRLQDGDTIRVDGHPNALSHRIITRAILDGLGYSDVGVR